MEPRRVSVHPLCWNSPKPRSSRVEGEVGEPGFMDTRTVGCEL